MWCPPWVPSSFNWVVPPNSDGGYVYAGFESVAYYNVNTSTPLDGTVVFTDSGSSAVGQLATGQVTPTGIGDQLLVGSVNNNWYFATIAGVPLLTQQVHGDLVFGYWDLALPL